MACVLAGRPMAVSMHPWHLAAAHRLAGRWAPPGKTHFLGLGEATSHGGHDLHRGGPDGEGDLGGRVGERHVSPIAEPLSTHHRDELDRPWWFLPCLDG